MKQLSEVERVHQKANEFNRYSFRLWVVLSLILSLAVIVILSKRNVVEHRLAYAAAVVLPLSFTLYFKNRIVRFGPFVYVAALLLMLSAAVYFGM